MAHSLLSAPSSSRVAYESTTEMAQGRIPFPAGGPTRSTARGPRLQGIAASWAPSARFSGTKQPVLDLTPRDRSREKAAWLGRTPKVLVALIALGSLSLAFRASEWVVDRPLSEDAFYCYAVSYNLAHGEGTTIDGTTSTNGFQPLFVFLCVPLFVLAGSDKVMAVRLVFVFEWALYIGTALLLGRIVRDFIALEDDRARSLTFWLTAVLYLSAGLAFLQHFNGLETGCLLFLYAAAWRYYQKNLRDSHRQYCALGALLGVLVLARVDASFFVAILCLKQFLSERKLRLRQRAERSLELCFFSCLVSCPWWIYNVLKFHSLMPSSGKAEQAWALSATRLRIMAVALERGLAPWVYLTESHWDWTVGFAVRSLLIVAVVAAGIRFRRPLAVIASRFASRGEQSRRTLEFAGCLVACLLALACWYALSSWATHFYTRYLSPLSLVAVFLLAAAGAQASRKLPTWASVGATALLVAPVLLGTAMLWRKPTMFGSNLALRQQLRLVSECVPPQAVVAAGQSGTIGYFRRRVVNLDGKVNAAALAYQSRMWEYLPKVGARWLCDWPSYVRHYLSDHPEEHGWKLVAEDGDFVLYRQELGAGGR